MKKNTFLVIIILLLLIFFHLINNYIWLKLDCLFVYPNDITNTIFHLDNQVKFYRALKSLLDSDSLLFEKIKSFIMFFRPQHVWPQYLWPGFMYCVTSIINLIFGLTPFITRFSNGIFLAILIIFTYLIGKACENKRAGLIAGFLISFYPGVFGISRLYDQDFYLMAMVSAALYLLIKAKKFTNKKYSMLLGLFSGLGILTNGRFFIFIIGPLLYIAYLVFMGRRSSSNADFFKQISNMIIFLFISLILSSVWWFGNVVLLDKVLTHLLVGYLPDKYNLFDLEYNVFTMRSIFFHISYLIDHVSIYLFLLFLISLFWVKKKLNQRIWVILLWFFIPLAIFTLVSAKWEHYCFSILPSVAVLTAVGMERFTKRVKFAVILFLIAISLLQFFEISYGFNFRPIKKMFSCNAAYWHPSIYKAPYKINNYENIMYEFSKDINNAISRRHKAGTAERPKVSLGVIDNIDAEINDVLISYYMSLFIDNINVMSLPNGIPVVPNPSRVAEVFSENINSFDFVIVINSVSSLHIDIDSLDIPKELLADSSYKRIIDNISEHRVIIDRKTLMPDKKTIFLLGREEPVL